MIDGVRGTRALVGDTAKRYLDITNTFHEVSKSYGFEFIKLPTIEKQDLFSTSVGQDTDIVTKQMFSFKDKKNRDLVLRPEGTAGVVRNYLDKKISDKKEYYYIEQMFRYERPQKGRYREFHQAGAEIMGYKQETVSEVFKVIQFSNDFLKNSIPSKSNFTFDINSIGNSEDRKKYNIDLRGYLEKNSSNLSKDSIKRINTNPMRILDSKDKNDLKIISDAPKINDYISDSSKKNYNELMKLLDGAKINYAQNSNLVRGLDYYNDFTFEIFPNNDRGSQDALGGGGEYNKLSELIGNKQLSAVGVAFGIDRIMEMFS